jgi:hypothetical protein
MSTHYAPLKNHLEDNRSSDLLKKIAANYQQDTISIGEFVMLLGDRSFALAILIFALPNAIPVPGIPGFSTITGLPILIIAVQIAMGRDAIWLPKKIASKRFSHGFLVGIIHKALPLMHGIEKFLKPRWVLLCEGKSERIIGGLIVVLAFILALPIPGGNFLPGLSIALLSLALLENDGLFAIIASLVSVGSILFMYKVITFVISSLISWGMHFIA